ncbi:MAG: hypothetical protein FWE02_07030 [Defluviitaleaceae bacterium]|nr:hypothetical protein [Defluviitaleaceae bacterium]
MNSIKSRGELYFLFISAFLLSFTSIWKFDITYGARDLENTRLKKTLIELQETCRKLVENSNGMLDLVKEQQLEGLEQIVEAVSSMPKNTEVIATHIKYFSKKAVSSKLLSK